jgi:alpha-tubulin suppressor-like RCC1 family protein
MLYVLTEHSTMYRINCETRAVDKISSNDDMDDEVRSQIIAITGGTDFVVTLKSDGSLFSIGKNSHG